MATFESLKLRAEIVKACRRQGFREATPIQSLVIPVTMRGRDAVVEAKTGSGKTLAYGLPLLNREPLQDRFPESLVVAPTRELAQQIAAELERSRGTLPRPVVTLSGGGGIDRQKAQLEAGAAIVVGTLGRIEELATRRMLRLDHVRTVVLDEVDELLRGGFGEKLAALFAEVPPVRQTLLFSATIPTEVEAVAKQFTRSAERLRLTEARELPAELTHRVLFTSVDDRVANLVAYLRAENPFQTLVFTGTRHEAEEVREAIADLGMEAEFLHGELSPNKRKQLLERVRSGDLPVLVASDLAARGLDLPGVDLVVNYSLPKGPAPYLHRAGRTGRAGRPGTVLSLVIGQQHELYVKLKVKFPFESVEVTPRGRVITRVAKTQEERDLQYRKLPRQKPVPAERPQPTQIERTSRPPRRGSTPEARRPPKPARGSSRVPKRRS